MMRRWTASVVRARGWARPVRGRGELRITRLRFDLLRRGRTGPPAQVTLHAHYRVAVGINLRVTGSARLHERSLHERRTELRQVLVRHASLRTMVRDTLRQAGLSHSAARGGSPLPSSVRDTAAGPPPHVPAQSRDATVLRPHGRTGTRWLKLRQTDRRTERTILSPPVPATVIVRVRQRTTHRHARILQPLSAAQPPVRATAAAQPATAHVRELHHAERLLYERRTGHSERLRTVHVRTPLRSAPTPPRWSELAPAPAAALASPRFHMVTRPVAPSPASAAVPSFTAAPQPLAAAPRAATPAPPPVERIERTLRESMTKVVQHTVRHEVERALRPDAQLSRRLRESIQSELYDDIVFERERLGER
jgi:hypothetical protein